MLDRIPLVGKRRLPEGESAVESGAVEGRECKGLGSYNLNLIELL